MHRRYLIAAPYWLAALLAFTILIAGCAMNVPVFVNNSSSASAKAVTLTVSGAASIRAASTTTFTASGSDGSSSSVKWSVNGEEGGDTSIGTIDSSGRFTAPESLPTTTVVTIGAAQTAAPFLSAEVKLQLLNP